jgi:serine/threonine-protein kinase
VLLLGIALALVLLLGQGIEVIDLVGRPQTEAALWANDNGLRLQAEETYSDEVAAGSIISQETAAGTRVKKGDFVRVTVSLGHDLTVTLPLPDLMSMTKDEVDAWAAANFMTKVRVTTEYNITVAAGRVIRYEINDDTVVGNEVRRDTPIYVIVSKGIDETVEQIKIPDFKAMTLSECYVFASENGLNLTVEERYDDYVPAGSVISQSVKAEEKLPRGSEIKLVASKGKKIIIPDFSDYTKEVATSVATELGVPVTVIEKYSSSSAGRFISQSIPAGTVFEKGGFLELCYSLGNKIVVPSFVGQTRDAIETWAIGLNEQGARITISASETNSNSPAGTIIYQTPANTTVGVKKTISITVSKGKVVYVPDFTFGSSIDYSVAITREQAITMCEELKLVPVFKEESKSGVLTGAIWKQSESAGKEVLEGTKITLTYTPATKVGVDDFVALNMDEAQVRAGVYLKKFNIIFVMAEEFVVGKDEGKVVAQSLVANTTVAAGTTITLYTNPPLVP